LSVNPACPGLFALLRELSTQSHLYDWYRSEMRAESGVCATSGICWTLTTQQKRRTCERRTFSKNCGMQIQLETTNSALPAPWGAFPKSMHTCPLRLFSISAAVPCAAIHCTTGDEKLLTAPNPNSNWRRDSVTLSRPTSNTWLRSMGAFCLQTCCLVRP